ncbi:MAG: LPS assembly protein LptD [Pyrinomonadaceae bacterium]
MQTRKYLSNRGIGVRALAWALVLVFVCSTAPAQQPNPVDRVVTNPVTDTPNVNPTTNETSTVPVFRSKNQAAIQAGTELEVTYGKVTITGPPKARIFVYEGDVDARIGLFRVQADKVTVYEADNRVLAEGNVVFDQGEDQRITGSRGEWNYRTKLGYFVNSTGYTNQTADGTIVYFTADRVERTTLTTIVLTNAEVTACDEAVPKWSFRTSRAEIRIGDKVKLRGPSFRIKNTTIFYLPYATIPIKRRDRASGFLTPTISASGSKGLRLSEAYYQTLGRSADVTLRGDVYSARGLGFGLDLRTRANSRSFFNFGFYTVKDRIFGAKADAEHPDQGGSSLYAEGIHYFPNGFVAAADVNITSNLAFRQIFSDGIQQAISPEERSEVFVNKNYNSYSFNFLARTRVTSIPDARIRIRNLPSLTFERRPSLVSFVEKLPLYYTYEAGLEGMSRKETPEDLAQFITNVGGQPIVTPSLVQRLDAHPQLMLPLYYKGWSATVTGGLRLTYYSNSIDPLTRLVISRDLVRGAGEFELDLRPPAMARNFKHGDGSFFFRHVIEPYLIYRRVSGINDFNRIIRFDYLDTLTDTNEIEYGITNRFFTRRSTERVSKEREKPVGEQKATTGSAITRQPYEAFTVTVRGKYFFDTTFGGALTPGRRNQLFPITSLSAFTYGGVPRRFSPVSVEARYRPSRYLYADVRSDFDVQTGGLRNMSATVGLNRPLLKLFTTFYYTRAISLIPSLQQYADANGKEPGTLRGSQWSPSFFVGNTERGVFGGLSLFFDFQNPRTTSNSPLVSSTATLGYSWDCCAVVVQYHTFNVGLRNENRFVFSFRLNGIGAFGTEQIGQRYH